MRIYDHYGRDDLVCLSMGRVEVLGDPTFADAVLGLVAHSSHTIELKATRSMRTTDARDSALP